MNKNILIIVYKFPPMGGIGTRRWVKFSKYLASNYNIHVLTSYYPYEDKVNWGHDIKHENIIVHKFKTYYPYWLLKKSRFQMVGKLQRIINFLLHKTIFYIDSAQYDAKPILTKAKKLISEYSIKNVIASGHPVSINYIATYLKIDMPYINLIQDYRDNWNDLNVYQYGSKNGLSFFKQKEKLAYQEFFTVYYSDVVINVSQDLTKALANKHKSINEKFMTITNGYDVDDFDDIEVDNSAFNLIYTGSLFNGRIEAIELLLDSIIDLNDEFINNNLKIVVYTNFDLNNLDIKYTHLLNEVITFKPFVSPSEIIEAISKVRYCLSINSKFASYAFGTKIFDYMALNKKILHISNGGYLFDLLESKEQFVSRYDLEEMKDIVLTMKNDYLNQTNSHSLEYKGFSMDALTSQLKKCFV